MNIIYIINEYNLRKNAKNIKQFNYLTFDDEQWENIGVRLSKLLPKEYNKPCEITIEATKLNPIIKVMYKAQDSIIDSACIKLTPYEVMVKFNDDEFKYSRALTKTWQTILLETFGAGYEDAKNLHYGIKTQRKV